MKALAMTFPLAATALAWFDNGVRGAPLGQLSPLSLPCGLIWVVCVMTWMRADARERGESCAEWRQLVFMLSYIAFPAWLMMSRGWRSLPLLGLYVVYVGALTSAGFVGAAMGWIVRR